MRRGKNLIFFIRAEYKFNYNEFLIERNPVLCELEMFSYIGEKLKFYEIL